MGNEEFISITHFINPQMFWYHKVDGQNPAFDQLQRVEESVQSLFTAKQSAALRPHRPVVGEIVAVAFVSWNKHIRARVESIAKYIKAEDEYIVWALDYGFPFRTKLCYVRKLPSTHMQITDHVRLGGVANVVPAELDFDFVTTTSKVVQKPTWLQRANEMLEKIILDAASISFIESFSVPGASEMHHFGDLKIINHSGTEFFASDFLSKLNYAVKCEDEFRSKLPTLKPTMVPYYETNGNESKIIENKLNSLNMHYAHQGKFNLSGSLSEASCDNLSKQKVIDWCERNENCNNNEPDVGGFCPATALDAADISFDDSVSVKNHQVGKRLENDESMMGYAGAVHENRRKKYQDKELPPKPSLDVFQVIPDKKAIQESQGDSNKSSSSASGQSQRTKALIELRKKHKQKKDEKNNENIPYEPLAKLEISAPSKAETEEFLEKCKKRNVVSARVKLKELRLKQAGDAQSNCTSVDEVMKETYAPSTTSSRHLLLQRIRESHLKKSAEKQETVSTVSSVKEDGQSESGVSAHVAKLISMRRKVREKNLRQDEDSALEQKPQPATQGYKMPPNNPKLTKIDFSNQDPFWEPPPPKNSHSVDLNANYDSDASNKSRTAREIELKNLRKTLHENPFKNMTMVPAGFDVTKLVKRNDVENHWHTKKTTLNDSVQSNGATEDWQTPRSSNSEKESIPRRTEDEEEQNFRLTLSRKERKKETTEKHPLDLSLSDSGCAPAITPLVVGSGKPNAKIPQDLLVLLDDRGSTATVKDVEDCNLNEAVDTSNTSADSFLQFVKAKVSVKDTSLENLLQTSDATSEESLESVRPAEKQVISKDSSSSSISSSTFSKVGCAMDEVKAKAGKSSSASSARSEKVCVENYQRPGDFLGSDKESRSSSSTSSSLVKVEEKKFLLPQSLGKLIPSLSSTSSIGPKENEKPIPSSSSSSSVGPKKDEKPIPSSSSSSSIGPKKNEKPIPLSSSSGSIKLSSAQRRCRGDASSSSSSTTMKQDLYRCVTRPTPTIQKADRLPEIAGESPLKTNFIEHLVLAHSSVKVTPIESMTSALFSPEIHREMEHMRLTKMYRIQSYAWAHLVRGNSFFVINASRTGKTWCYLPPLCSMVSFRYETKGVPQTCGPVAVIVAPSSVEVESITRQCRRLLSGAKSKVTVVPSYAFRNAEDVKIELHNGCGILVITPPSLQRLLITNEREPLLNLGRIAYVVIDDLDTQLMKDKECEATLQKFIAPFIHRQQNGKVPFQMVVTSKKWSRRLVNLLKISNQPLLCIADYLEAAVYGKAKISIKLQSSEEKTAVMIKYLTSCAYNTERVLIVCSTHDEVDDVVKVLSSRGIACFAYTDQMPVESSNLVNEWKKKAICHQILVTVDTVLPEVVVQNVWTLIHYSLPRSWTKFTFRFSAFLTNLTNMLSQNFVKPEKVPRSVILLDENNNLQLPRLIEFMKNHDQIKHIHPDILKVVARVTAEREECRVSQGIRMCPKILEFGSCDESSKCPYRHQLTRYDGPADDIPTRGQVRVKILEVFSPTHYTARILNQRVDGKWEVAMRSDMVPQFLMKLSFHFLSNSAHVVHWPLKINDLCVYKGEGIFHRCRLLEVPAIAHENIVKQVNVKVKLIDSGPTLMCKSHDLLVLPDDFKDFPPQAVDIRLSGVVPFDNERVWDSRSTRAVRKWIITDVTENDCVEASVNFTLMDTIWVHNIVLLEKLPAINGFAVKTNVRRSLLGKGFALADESVHLVKETAIENGLLMVPLSSKLADKPIEVKEEERNLLEFSTSTSTEGEDSSIMEEEEPTSRSEPLSQRAPTSQKEPMSPRGPTSQSEMTPIPIKSVARKPKVPIKSVEEWAELELEELIHVKISHLHDPRKFYVRALKKDEELQELEELIQQQPKTPLEDAHPTQNCLAPHDGRYHRGKIQRLLIDSAEGNVHARVFFCDLGFFSNLPLDQLRASSEMLIEFMPFQAVCCQLIGIRVESVGKEVQDIVKVENSAHLAYAVKKVFDGDINSFDIENYAVILYECFTDKRDIQINKLLVERGLASYDEDTRHFLELETKFCHTSYDGQEQNEEPYDFQTFLDRIREQIEEEGVDVDHIMCFPDLNALADAQKEEPKIVELPSSPPPPKPVPKIPKEAATPSPVAVQKTDPAIPPLKALYKRPQTTWYETMCMIFLVIHAPDVTDYHLEVTPKKLIFVAHVNGEQQVLLLDLLGYIEPDKVMHEVRGLNVIVRLVKSVHMEWPRLLENPTKYSWLTYNFNAISTSEVEKVIENASRPKRSRMLSYSSDTSESSNSNPCETFTPIVNTDQVHDPMEEYF